MQFVRAHQLEPDEHGAVGGRIDQERRRRPEHADREAGHGRADDPRQVEDGAVQRDRVGHAVPADHLHRERLPRRVVDHSGQPEGERERVDLPDADGSGQRQHAQDERQPAHDRLSDHQDPPLGVAVGDHSAPQAEQQERQELQSGGDAERGAAVVGELQHQPVLRYPLHPAAGIRDDLAGREEPVVASPEASRRSCCPIASGLAWTGGLTGRDRLAGTVAGSGLGSSGLAELLQDRRRGPQGRPFLRSQLAQAPRQPGFPRLLDFWTTSRPAGDRQHDLSPVRGVRARG